MQNIFTANFGIMWLEFKTEEKPYFYECKVVKNRVTFVIFDLKDSWCEKIRLKELLERANDLNKRIKFNDYDIEDALTSTESVEARFVDVEDSEQQRSLHLKYLIHRHPFHFRWHLKTQTEKEFREAITLPLFTIVRGMQQQIAELRDVIVKKDKEINQYKEDGAELKITTVATKPFDFIQFDTKFSEVNRISRSFQLLAENVMLQVNNESKNEKSVKDLGKTTTSEGKAPISFSGNAETSNFKIESKQLLNSPRARKHKSWELRQQRMAMKLEARKQKLQYESSQSQGIEDSETEADSIQEELADIGRSIRAFKRSATDSGDVVESDISLNRDELEVKRKKIAN